MYRGPDRGYYTEPSKSLFIADNPEEKEAENMQFEQAGLNINYVDGSRYLGAFMGTERI